MNSVRGGDKTPGEFRTSQNWIGGAGSTLKNSRYIPPNPEDMIECLSDFEKFMNEDDGMDPLIKVALLHYQFETIHPFLDGNGRLGRLLITLFLMGMNEISSPVLYLSCYLPTGNKTADGTVPYEGIVSSNKEHLGMDCIMYDMDLNAVARWECRDVHNAIAPQQDIPLATCR